MAETTAAPETAKIENDVLTPEEESQLHGEEAKAEKSDKTEVKTQEEKKEDKVVPYAAMHEERMRRKEIQRKLQETEAKTALMEKRLHELSERFKPAAPKFEENPAAHLKHEIEMVRGEIAETKKFKEEHEKIRQEQQREQEFINNYRAQADVFRSKSPDFDNAYQFLMQSRVSEYKAMGYPEQKARQMIINEERMIVEDAFNDEANPAERIYSLAKARGYAKEKSEAEKQIETVQKGLEASKTLSKGGGSSGGLTVQALAEMSEEEFHKIDEATFRKLMGG